MSNSTTTPVIESSGGFSPPLASLSLWHRLKFLHLPLWGCFVLAVIARVWLVVHTQGVIAGDEAVVGIQAEHILRGEHPIYFYGQPYMGSLQAYLIALIFLLTHPSAGALRVEPILVSLVLVYLTWRFSAALADAAHLSRPTRTLFMVIATLVAAFPPLYDVVEEMRTTGGYVEAFAIMLWLLFCAFRLTERWHANASPRELSLRWAGIGFLVGLGFWINPLVVYACVTIALWFGGFFISELVRPHRQADTKPYLTTLKKALLFVMAIPVAFVGFVPGLYWGAHHQWQNIRYIFQNGSTAPNNRLHTILNVQHIYITCLAPRTMGGALPTQPGVTVANPHLLTFGLVVSACCLAISVVCVGLSFFWPHALLVQIRRLTALPLLFFLCASIIFCSASIAAAALASGCGPWDLAGRYVVPLVIALPFFIAAAFSIPALFFQERKKHSAQVKEDTQHVSQLPARLFSIRSPLAVAIQVGSLAVLAIYFCVQGLAYIEANPRFTFQATGCVAANPTDIGPIINYMQRADIRFAWATGWIADPITFTTNGAILVTEPQGRIPANSAILLHADRPSILLLARHDDPRPAFLKALDARHVTYQVERFYSVPSIDTLVITPLNRTVSPLDPHFAAVFKRVFYGCV